MRFSCDYWQQAHHENIQMQALEPCRDKSSPLYWSRHWPRSAGQAKQRELGTSRRLTGTNDLEDYQNFLARALNKCEKLLYSTQTSNSGNKEGVFESAHTDLNRHEAETASPHCCSQITITASGKSLAIISVCLGAWELLT